MVDPLPELQGEAEERGIKSAVAADPDRSVAAAYETLAASMHPGVKPGHTFILVDMAGNMVWRSDWTGHGSPMYVNVDELYRNLSARMKS